MMAISILCNWFAFATTDIISKDICHQTETWEKILFYVATWKQSLMYNMSVTGFSA